MNKHKYLCLLAILTFGINCLRVEAQHTDNRIFIFCPAEKAGLHIACDTAGCGFTDIGQLCSSDYGPWDTDKRMITPFVLRTGNGTWRAVWSVNESAPTLATTYSDDIINWRPQDYPLLSEHGISNSTISENQDGSFTITYSSAGKDYAINADSSFRHFSASKEVTQASIPTAHRDTILVDGKLVVGQLFNVGSKMVRQIVNEYNSRKADAALSSETMLDDSRRFGSLKTPVSAILNVDTNSVKPISDRLIGVFFEDINHAADGGLYAEMLQNGDFEYTEADHQGWKSATAWQPENKIRISTEQPLSPNNAHHAIIGNETFINYGWNGIANTGAIYTFNIYARSTNGKKSKLNVALTDSIGNAIASGTITIKGSKWAQYGLRMSTKSKQRHNHGNLQLRISGPKKGEVAIDMASLMPAETYKGHGLRKDLAEAIAALHPKFVRFPGGCMSHGDGIDNIYHWNHTIGPLKDRRPAKNIWGYHQSRGLGFYEYFQFCEDIGAEPLPVLAAGVPCQNSKPDANGLAGQQGGIAMNDMPTYIDEILNLIEWANGDAKTSPWARLRAEAGHEAPFGLKMIGIGNEDLVSTAFEERYLMICKAIKAKYPQIEVCGTVGPFHAPSSDYREGWKIARANRQLFDMVDEHYYESTGWFMHHQDYYDHYDRQGPKVYLGEYASRTRTMESALAEALHLCNVERNADVVLMTSYAPLLCHEDYKNWNPNLIYFNNYGITSLTPSYYTQRLFGTHSGDRYIASHLQIVDSLSYRVAATVVSDSKTGHKYIKVVNALPVELHLRIDGIRLGKHSFSESISGLPADKSVSLVSKKEQDQTVVLPPYTVKAIEI